jgi:transcriptional regulator with XRE-family HTH domain
MLDRHSNELTNGRYMVNRQIELPANVVALDKGAMTLGQRIEERRVAAGISQAELARRVGVRQSTMNSLINGDSRSSRSIVQIARELGTSPAYLMGDIDDPNENAPPPPPAALVQLVTMQVALPSERALARMFEGLLRSMDLSAPVDAQALLLAKRLPIALSQLRDLLPDSGLVAPAQVGRVQDLATTAPGSRP